MTQCGTIRALGLQNLATYMNIITFYLIMIPISVGLTFHAGTHTDYVTNSTVTGLGLAGVWTAVSIALVF